MNPSARSGRVASTYTMRGATVTSRYPAATSSGYSLRPISESPPACRCRPTRHSTARRAWALSGWK
ncbi:MAG TPA: hypothetical protein VHY31_07620 [Streptosporangiaceae bacterium]|nr:hypothetical protein [Streptosporangiaceae bacterium]